MASMSKSKVALVKCDTYDCEQVINAVEKGVRLIGGISTFIKEGEKILIKPNVLIGTNPEKCVCTHPSVFRAVGVILKKAKVAVSYGDSSGFGRSEVNMKRAKLKQVADELGIFLADFSRGQHISHNGALLNKRFFIANSVLESDGLVSLPKLKTHGLVRFTGAVKNQFGCIPGLRKSQFHVKMADPFDFATMLVDLNTLIKPRIYIMDGIMAMEGNGPRSGKPKKLGVLLFSSDPVALDSIACRIIDLNPEYVPTSKPGEKSGLGTYHYENIEVIGENMESAIDKNFDVVRKPVIPISSGWLRTLIRDQICPKPIINEAICTNCGTCVKYCQTKPKAVNWHNTDETSPPTYKYEHCIRCYCCQELCPEGAISLREAVLGRIFNR
jgi:uncharacterized protein (DUF362 family)/Pyruvate/2-oxoacid:ferredoxin oxidoreductase delta subunit